MTKIQLSRFCFGLIACMTVAACEQNGADVSEPKTSEVQIADAAQFDPAEMNALGVNENGKGMKVGDHPASVTIADIYDNEYSLDSAWAEQPALVVFYRGGWCPYCNGHVKELVDAYPRIAAAGVQPVLISVDSPDKAAMLKAKYEIPFPVLSDPSLKAHKAFNVVLEVDDTTMAKYKDFGIDLEQWSGEVHGSIAIASTFIVDSRGHIVFSHAPADFKSRPTAEQLVGLVENFEL